MNIIFEYSGITNDMDNLTQFLNSIMSSNISHSSSFLFRRFCFNLLLWIVIVITYILLYHSSIHIIDSNRSFVEVPCVLAYNTSCTSEFRRRLAGGEPKDWQKCIYQFDLSDYFHKVNNAENNMFYGEIYVTNDQHDNNYTHSVYCSINEDTFKYRYLDEGEKSSNCTCECCGYHCCRKCGRCCDYCYKCGKGTCSLFDENCCLLCCTIALGTIFGVLGCVWLSLSEFIIRNGYEIVINEEDDHEEALLVVGDTNSGEGFVQLSTI